MKSKEERLEELKRKIIEDPKHHKGMFTAADLDGATRMRHWRESSTRSRRGQTVLTGQKRTPIEFEFKPQPIRKRTPQERVESLTRRLLDHLEETYKRTGTPELPADLLYQIKSEYWRVGDPVSASGVNVDTIRAIATKYMEMAERQARRK